MTVSVSRPDTPLNKRALYCLVQQQLRALVQDESDWIANLANASSLMWHTLPDLNWAGFYLYKGGDLVLGPFQGKPACVRIAMGKGVCGTAAAQKQTIVVPNVHEFVGHIACDAASNSEIVVPLIQAGTLRGVLDLDSPQWNRFDEDDKRGLEGLAAILIDASDIR